MNIAANHWLPRHRIDVDAFNRMAEIGVLAPDDRVELIEGEIIDMAPISSRHAALTNKLNRLLTQSIGERAIVAVQQPIRLGTHSEPQPDIAILKSRADFYGDSHPAPADIHLLVEISSSSLRYDREIKVPLYARHMIPEVWLVDVQEKEIVCLRAPVAERYGTQFSIRTDTLGIALLPEVAIDIHGLFDY